MLISSNFASQTRWSIFALGPQMYQATPVLITQDQSPMTSPSLAWRSEMVHMTNPFNPLPMKIL